MSDITFKVNNPLKIKSGTGVSISSDGKSFDEKGFDGQQKADIRISIPQEVGTNSNVEFNKVSLSPETLTIGTGSRKIVLKDGIISGSLNTESEFIITGNYIPEEGLTFKGGLNAPTQSFAATQTTQSNNTGSTKFGTEIDSHRQRFTGSLELTGSFDINDIAGELIEISNDGNLTDASSGSLITEAAASTYLASLRPDRDYLRKSFVHTGSFINSTTSSFNAITASAPSNLSTTNENDFMFFINGMLVENNALTINQKTSTNLELRLDSSELGYTLEVSDEIIGFGKFNS